MVLSTIGDARRGSERRKEGSSSRGPARLGVPSTLSLSAAAKRCAPALTRATSRSTRCDAGRGSERSWKEGSSRGPARLGVPSTSSSRAPMSCRAAAPCRASRSAAREAVRSASRARPAARGSSRTPLAASSSHACAIPAATAANSCGRAAGWSLSSPHARSSCSTAAPKSSCWYTACDLNGSQSARRSAMRACNECVRSRHVP